AAASKAAHRECEIRFMGIPWKKTAIRRRGITSLRSGLSRRLRRRLGRRAGEREDEACVRARGRASRVGFGAVAPIVLIVPLGAAARGRVHERRAATRAVTKRAAMPKGPNEKRAGCAARLIGGARRAAGERSSLIVAAQRGRRRVPASPNVVEATMPAKRKSFMSPPPMWMRPVSSRVKDLMKPSIGVQVVSIWNRIGIGFCKKGMD
ncbi:hypothetical protein, partial [Burkholderia oklahomensis]|uniref:hypothetical protein n=1 Tax=Burkholderia oklahomensis TaxID=342113 RepID=UPI000ABF5B49